MISASYWKNYWDDQLTDLKSKSITANDMWKAVVWLVGPAKAQFMKPKDFAKAEYKLSRSNKQTIEDKHIF